MHILSVEDDPEIIGILRRGLGADGHTLEQVTTGEEGLEKAERKTYDLVILDIGLPGMDGFEVIERLRAGGAGVPVIMLTAEGSEEATVRGLTSGADDYIVKPFSVRELRARIEALARRTGAPPGTRRRVGDFQVDLGSRSAQLADRSVRLTHKELSLLWALAEAPVRTWTREELLSRVWGIDFDPKTKILDVHLSRLRKKLTALGEVPVETVPGEGYRLKNG